MQKTFDEKYRELVIESKMDICEIIDVNLWGLGRMAIEEAGDLELGLQHLSNHFQHIVQRLVDEPREVTLQ